jgi:hypothetical protein
MALHSLARSSQEVDSLAFEDWVMNRVLVGLSAVTLALMSVQGRAIASTFSIKQITSEIRQKVDFPILLPSETVVERYRFDQAETIYADTSTSDSGYEVSFNNRPGPVGNAAFRFSISAYPGKEIERMNADMDPKYSPTFNQVKLADGSQSLVTMWCGGTACWSTVQWKSRGILYRVAAKQRQPKTAIVIANSAVKAGDR